MICDLDGCSDPARLYPRGWRCEADAPRPLPPTPDEALTLDGLRDAAQLDRDMTPTPSASYAAVDARAIASGKRRAPSDGQRLARQIVDGQKQRTRDLGGR